MSGCDENGDPLDPLHPWYTDQRTREEAISERLEKFRRAFNDGHQEALEAALKQCDAAGRELPGWAVRPLAESLQRDRRNESRGQRGRKPWEGQHADDMEDLDRFEAVREAVAVEGYAWDDAYAAASRVLYGHDGHEDAVKKAHQRVKRRMEAEPGRYLALRSPCRRRVT
ncbi:hypothetical protein SAMN05660831_02490 [Thiohalospira halophila DSM 15071]|uniref:Uncharacterized protein n=1 Tax=Thiohalospira halophila DSM 15071 TaxID=1123397 RepID=A0A1I1VUI0_9GAMM|nr:hypothetical protein [Thiohalospira halophila]SFD86494.1 hypothetical protein SAMN05660831_02490 [Thiohalospira halophila DSM 15071]